MLCAMRYNSDRYPRVQDSLVRAMAYRMLTYCRSDGFRVFDAYASWLLQHYDGVMSGDPEWESAKCAHFTESELHRLWVGQEPEAPPAPV